MRFDRLAAAPRFVVLLLLLPLVLAACGSHGGDDDPGWFVRYERVWADGLTERETLWPDGRVLMRHGEYLERITMSKDDMATIQAALASPPAVGTAERFAPAHDDAARRDRDRLRPAGPGHRLRAARAAPRQALDRAVMRAGSRSHTVAAVGWALAGVLAAHMEAYRIVYPDAAVHDEVLASTGHVWMAYAGPLVVMSLAVAVAAGLLGGRRWRRRGVRFATLAAIQVSAYVALEFGERIAAGADARLIVHQLRDHGFWLTLVIGCALQVLAALLGSAASGAVARAAQASPAVPPGAPASAPLPELLDLLVAPLRRAAHGTRAPPAAAPIP